jgi:hypothetical protein
MKKPKLTMAKWRGKFTPEEIHAVFSEMGRESGVARRKRARENKRKPN